MTRAGVSSPSNIAEGAERASNAELRTQIAMAYDIDLIKEHETIESIAETKSISKMLHALITSLKHKTETGLTHSFPKT